MHTIVVDSDLGRRAALVHILNAQAITVIAEGTLEQPLQAAQFNAGSPDFVVVLGRAEQLGPWLSSSALCPQDLPLVLVTPRHSVDALVPLLHGSVLTLLNFAEGIDGVLAGLRSLYAELRQGPPVSSMVAAARRYFLVLQKNQASGILSVSSQGASGQIFLRAGRVIDGLNDGLRGEAAVASLLTHLNGTVQLGWTPLHGTGAVISPSAHELPELVGALTLFDAQGHPVTQPEPGWYHKAGPLDILLVDDEEELRTLYASALRHAGFAVRVAKDGKDAMTCLEQKRPDAVLSDMMMPRLDGWGLLGNIRNDARYRELPFAFVSCHHDFLQQLQALDAGADAYISKGVRLDEFVGTLREILAAHVCLAQHLVPGQSLRGGLGRLGPVTLMRMLAMRNVTGVLQLRDFWANYRLSFSAGSLAHAEALVGDTILIDADALASLLGVREGVWQFDAGHNPSEWTLGEAAIEVIERSCVDSNTRETESREHLLSCSQGLVPRKKLLDFYQSVSVPGTEPVLEQIRSGVAPRDILIQSQFQPLLVDWLFQDLLRKGVVHFAETAQLAM